MTTSVAPAPASTAAPATRWTFDLFVFLAGSWFVLGLVLDGWAHNHLDLSREGFFTPYHAVFYTGYAALASVVLVATWRTQRATGLAWRDSVPAGYGVTLAGLAVFAAGGVLDMLWHIAFGVEQELEALFSPTHLLLATGGALMLSGPIRAGVARARERSWAAAWPALAPLAFFATLVSFFFMWAFSPYASLAADPHAMYPALGGDALGDFRDRQLEHGITAVVMRSSIATGFALWAARRMTLPFGAVAALTAVPTTLIAAMLAPEAAFVALNLGAALAGGFAADALLARANGSAASVATSRAVGVALPFAMWTVYLLGTAALGSGFWWTPHVMYGVPVIGALCGLLLAIATERPATRSATTP